MIASGLSISHILSQTSDNYHTTTSSELIGWHVLESGASIVHSQMVSQKQFDMTQLPTEILEHIFLQIDDSETVFRDIFRCRVVCTKWKDVIAGSTKIQQKIFLRTKWNNEVEGGALSTWLKHISKAIPVQFSLKSYAPDKCFWSLGKLADDDGVLIKASINPLVEHHFMNSSRVPLGSLRLPSVSIKPHAVPPFLIRDLPVEDSAQWRSMLLTQPPVSSILLIAMKDEHKSSKGYQITAGWQLFNRNGVTLGDLDDLHRWKSGSAKHRIHREWLDEWCIYVALLAIGVFVSSSLWFLSPYFSTYDRTSRSDSVRKGYREVDSHIAVHEARLMAGTWIVLYLCAIVFDQFLTRTRGRNTGFYCTALLSTMYSTAFWLWLLYG